jgi:hypothetical protein
MRVVSDGEEEAETQPVEEKGMKSQKRLLRTFDDLLVHVSMSHTKGCVLAIVT